MSSPEPEPAPASSQTISFEDIVSGRDSTVRVTSDGLIYAVDLVMVVTGKNRNDSAQALRRLDDDVFHNVNIVERVLPGRGQGGVKLLTFQHAIELVMVLPGKVAKETRVQFANVLRRYMAGDESLVADVRANAHSSSPVAQLARQSLQPQQQEETLEDRKRRREIEDVDLQCKRMSVATSFISSMSLLNPTWADDARLRVQTQDLLKNIALRAPGSQFLLTDEGDARPSSASLNVSDVAADMGLRLKIGQLSQVGVSVAAAYRRRYGRDPPRRQQFVAGAERWVNAYTEADRDLIQEALEKA